VHSPTAIAVVTDYDKWNAAAAAGSISVADDSAFVANVLVIDGNQVNVFDAKLNLVRTLTGFSSPMGVDGDTVGGIFVTDTGNNQVLHFAPDGTPDKTFGGTGSLTGPSDVPFKHPTALALSWHGLPSDASGTALASDPILTVLDQGNDRLVVCGRDNLSSAITCSPVLPQLFNGSQPDATPLKGLAAMSAIGESFTRTHGACCDQLPPITVADGTSLLRQPSDSTSQQLNRVSMVNAPLVSIAASRGTHYRGTYLAGIDGQGRLHEWIDHGSEARQSSLPFNLQAVAVDASGSWIQVEQAKQRQATAQSQSSDYLGPPFSPYETGPIVLYVAGAGHLQRRVFSSLTGGP
jgi:hypothetical protein